MPGYYFSVLRSLALHGWSAKSWFLLWLIFLNVVTVTSWFQLLELCSPTSLSNRGTTLHFKTCSPIHILLSPTIGYINHYEPLITNVNDLRTVLFSSFRPSPWAPVAKHVFAHMFLKRHPSVNSHVEKPWFPLWKMIYKWWVNSTSNC